MKNLIIFALMLVSLFLVSCEESEEFVTVEEAIEVIEVIEVSAMSDNLFVKFKEIFIFFEEGRVDRVFRLDGEHLSFSTMSDLTALEVSLEQGSLAFNTKNNGANFIYEVFYIDKSGKEMFRLHFLDGQTGVEVPLSYEGKRFFIFSEEKTEDEFLSTEELKNLK